ncbi:hypothetical protein ACFL1V_07025 [Pseudomonadota bacterium]
MNSKTLSIALAGLLITGAGSAMACEYKAGETKFMDYANCRYNKDSLLVVDLPEGSNWDNCVYYLEAFRPEKLLAVTKERDGKESHSINDRGKIGNPCYITKQSCDEALKVYKKKEGIL